MLGKNRTPFPMFLFSKGKAAYFLVSNSTWKVRPGLTYERFSQLQGLLVF